MTEPTDAEVEAMAEKLWEAWRRHVQSPRWADCANLAADMGGHYAKKVKAFRAMARVALQADENGDEVRG